MNNSAVTLNQAASEVVNSARGAPPQVAASSNRFSKAYEDFLDSGLEFAGVTKDTTTQSEIVTGLRSVSMTSSKLLVTTKTMLADPEAPNAKNLLANAARWVNGQDGKLNTVRCHYNAVDFTQNHHSSPVRDMGCLLWIQTYIHILPQSPQ